MTAADHEQLRAKAEAATRGPWGAYTNAVSGVMGPVAPVCSDCRRADAAFIAAANPATIIALLDEMKTLRAALEQIADNKPTEREAPYQYLRYREAARRALVGGDQPDRNQP